MLTPEIQKEILDHTGQNHFPKRKALSLTFPIVLPFSIFAHQKYKSVKNLLKVSLLHQSEKEMPVIIVSHQSPLKRRATNGSDELQINKVKNLEIAIKKLDGIIIPSGKTFSFWKTLGRPTKKNGYVSGMLLANGKIVPGIGGGICQLSNLLYWLFLHSELKVLERHHHSHDVFPDEGRVLPFGSGATVLYNFYDLQVKNTTPNPIQIKLWLTEKYLKGKLLSDHKNDVKIHIFEKEHLIVRSGDQYFRYNQIWKEKRVAGKLVGESIVTKNFAPILYPISESYLKKNGFQVVDVKDFSINH